MKVAVLGAGAGGAASVAELVQAGHDVHFWARSAETLEPHVKLGGVAHDGKLGEGVARPALITTDLKAAVDAAIYGALRALGGSFSAEHGIGSKRIAALERYADPTKVALMAQLKALLDPANLCNPGKIVA